MASGKKANEKTDYSALIKELRESGPKPLYLLWGEEDYLCESFYAEVKKLCLADGGEEFNYHRLKGSPFNAQALSEALDTIPFMGGRSFIEVRGFEINSCREETVKRLGEILTDIPDYATAVFILPTGYEPDGRLAATKLFKKHARAIEFTTQAHGLLCKWIATRFAACGKKIGREEAERLIFLSGERMTGLVQEIEKIASYEPGEAVSMETVDKVAHHIPEAKVFEMTDLISNKKFDQAAHVLAELLESGENEIKTLAMIGIQMRRLYAGRLAIDKGLGRDFVMDVCKISYPSHAENILRSARGFTTAQLKNALKLCAQCDYRMKSSSEDDEAILIELFLRIASGEAS